LPVSRIHLMLTRAGVGCAQIFALSLLPPFLITGASHLMHQAMPLSYGLRFVPLWAIGGMLTFALSFLASVVIPNEYGSLAAAYMAYIFYLAGVRHPRLGPYHMHVADFMSGFNPGQLDTHTMLWGATYPLTPIFGFFAAAAMLVVASTLITTRQDF
jgi:ABC-2 type transport system permease protein